MQAIVRATEECLGHLGSIQSSTGDFLSKQEEPLDLPMTQFLPYRIWKIDGIVRCVSVDALQISQMVKGALERFINTLIPREVLRPL